MIPINKLMAVAIALLAMVAVSACSSYEDPDTAFKGKIDDGFMNSMARGETSVTFRQTDYLKYEMDYNAYQYRTGKWSEAKELLDGESTPGINGLTVLNGNSWRPVNRYQIYTGCPSSLFSVWTIYEELNGFNKAVYVSCPVEYNADNKTFKVEDTVYNIEKATDNELVLSTEGLSYSMNNQHELVPSKATKYIMFYNKAAMEIPDIENCIYSESETNAKLQMVKILREYFGDEINLNHYHGNMLTYPIVNLKKIEEHLRSGKDEYEKDVIGKDSK
ncbi:MAG: hypothetical protein K2L77_02820 [Muribaculaceae bacterium]|nr:hypothetical protein [Muribaculaceae bacterium]